MKKAFRVIWILCGILLIVGIAVMAVAYFTGGSWQTVVTHGNLTGFREQLLSHVPNALQQYLPDLSSYLP